MPINYIPPQETRRWTGPYLGNFYGTLWKTFNIDLDRSEGKISISRRMERIEDTGEFTGENAFHVFLRSNADCDDRYYALRYLEGLSRTDSAATPLPSLDWDTLTDTNAPLRPLDMAVVGNDSRVDSGRNQLFVTTDTDISVLNDTGNNAWTSSWWVTKKAQPGLRSGFSHPIEYFPLVKIALIGDANLVHTISRPSDTQNETVTYARLTLPTQYAVRHIFTTANRAWILCTHQYGGEGAIVEWDGSAGTYNAIHSAFAVSPIAGTNYRESPIILNSKGLILGYTGQGFSPLIRNGQTVALPCWEIEGAAMVSDTTGRAVPRGMITGEDGLIYMNLRQPTVSTARQDAGIWCLNPATGRIYHKYALGVVGDSADKLGGMISQPGGIYYISAGATSRQLLAGANILFNDTSQQTGIWLQELGTAATVGRGYFITQFIPSNDVKETWDTLWIRFRQLIIDNGGRIIVKAKGPKSIFNSARQSLESTITWTSATTFTTTLGAGDDSLGVGDEVEVLAGRNAGYIAHITSISGAHGALQTITIDETCPDVSGTSKARFERWKKLNTITISDKYEVSSNIGIDASFIQFKVVLEGPTRDLEISDMIVTSKPAIKIQN